MQLKAENLGFRYRKEPWLFQNLNLVAEPGEIIGLTGPSGCGKSTFCRILAGYEKPLEGRVLLDGRPVPKQGFHPVQFVFQHPEKAVNPRWKMHKVLQEGWEPDQETLEALGIQSEWLGRRPGELSGGELQRFCIARALGPKTKFLIADEMTTMLDAITQAQIWHAVMDIARKGEMGMIIVSHEPKLISRLCDRVLTWGSME